MKINKEELQQIILEEMVTELDASTTAINKGMRGQQMQKNVSSAGTGGREAIARLQRVVATIGQQKMTTVPAPVKIALQKLEAALGIDAAAPEEEAPPAAPQQGDRP